MKQKIKFVKRFMSVVVAATMVFAMVTGIGDFFSEYKIGSGSTPDAVYL